jgi:hypothetical protein
MNKKHLLLLVLTLGVHLVVAQQSLRTITTSLPFLSLDIHPQTYALGNLGVVAAPTYSNSALWQNSALLAREQQAIGGNLSYAPWLRSLGFRDIFFLQGGFFTNLDENQAIGIGLKYFDLGRFNIVNPSNPDSTLGIVRNPAEFQAKVSYGRRITDHLSLGVGLSFVHSALISIDPRIKPVNTVLGDLGLFYEKYLRSSPNGQLRLSWGISVTNLGPKVSYFEDRSQTDFVPTTLKLGGMVGWEAMASKNTLVAIDLAYQIDKLLVPSDAATSEKSALSGLFSGFSDAPNGFRGEMQELVHQLGFEVRVQPDPVLIALRLGHFNEHVDLGGRKNVIMGLGFGVYGVRLDVSRVILTANRTVPSIWQFGLSARM